MGDLEGEVLSTLPHHLLTLACVRSVIETVY